LEQENRAKVGQITSLIGLGCNILLAVLKLIVGIASGMISIVADSVNNFSDSISSIVSLIGFKLSSKPADKEHPFGHARFEYISGMVLAFLVMIAGVELLKESIQKIIHPAELKFGTVMYIVLWASVAVKLFMFLVYRFVGKKIDSGVLKAAAADSRNDVITTMTVIFSALVSQFTSLNLDGWAGALVAAFVLVSGIGLLKDTIDPLLGTVPDPEFVKELQEKILSYEGVLGVHDLMIHDYGPQHRMCSVHVEVRAEDGIIACHDLIDRIENEMEEQYHMSVLIHYDPIITAKDEADPIYLLVKEELKEINEKISMHDFRISFCDDKKTIGFDCVVPEETGISCEDIKDRIEKRIADRDASYVVKIHFDKGLLFFDEKS